MTRRSKRWANHLFTLTALFGLWIVIMTILMGNQMWIILDALSGGLK